MKEFVSTLLRVVDSPASAIAGVMEKKRWRSALVAILLVTAVAAYITYPISKVEQAKLFRDSEMADKLSDEQLADMDRVTPGGRVFGALAAAFFSGLVIVMGAFFIYLFYKVGGTEGLYVNYFSAVVHASFLDMLLGGVLRSGLILVKKSIMVQTGLTLFFPNLDFRSLPYITLAQFDFFSLWYLAALALGVAVYAKLSPRKSLLIAAFYFLFKSVIFIGFALISIRITGM